MQYYSENGRYISMVTRDFDSNNTLGAEGIILEDITQRNIMYYSIFLMDPSYAIENESTILSELNGYVGVNEKRYYDTTDYDTLDYTATLEDLGLT